MEKGKMKAKVEVLRIKDVNVSSIIKNVLIENGYDLIINPILNEAHFFVCEEIEVYRTI